MDFVESGIVLGGVTPSLEDYVKEEPSIQTGSD